LNQALSEPLPNQEHQPLVVVLAEFCGELGLSLSHEVSQTVEYRRLDL
jgi:hypothetical protein